MAEPIDTGILRAATAVNGTVPRVDLLALCDEVDRLRAENAALAAALGDIAGMLDWNELSVLQGPDWRATAECAGMNGVCHHRHPDDPDKDTAASQWEALAWACSGARTTHLGELTPDEASVFRTRMIDVAEGRAVWAESSDPQWLGWTLNYEAGA